MKPIYIPRIPDLIIPHTLRTDSYKLSHWKQYPEGTTRMVSYLESRGGEFDECTLFGLKYILNRFLTKPLTKEDVEFATNFAILHGEPFNAQGWMHIVDTYEGRLPVKIRAIKEGTVVPVKNCLLTIECDDPDCFWVVSWLETMLVRLWYPSTIAMGSRESKKVLIEYFHETSDRPLSDVLFKLHDFGARGVTCEEQAMIGGAAHLTAFLGSDTIEGILMANHYYKISMAGFSIPASEHSTVSMWGRMLEHDMFKHYAITYLANVQNPEGIPKLAACVSDTYNVYQACEWWTTGELKNIIKNSGGTIVVRPDSGDPLEVLPKMFEIFATNIGDEITVNSKGFRVLPSWIRVIQGDGIDRRSMKAILRKLADLKWSVDNIAFGSGGGLLQKVNRDTQKWAFKCCYAEINGVSVDVRKDPITDPGKQSKEGRLDLIQLPNGKFDTIKLPDGGHEYHENSIMDLVYDLGYLTQESDVLFTGCRLRLAVEGEWPLSA